MITEDQLEQLCLAWFQASGYEVFAGKSIAPESDTSERRDYRQVILTGRFLDALVRINPSIPKTVLEDQVVHFLGKAESPMLIQNNHQIQKYLLNGVPVEYSDGDQKKNDYVQIIDFHNQDNNQFLAVNQFTIVGSKQLRRPDVVVFINGLPIAVIELKNLGDENAGIWEAYN